MTDQQLIYGIIVAVIVANNLAWYLARHQYMSKMFKEWNNQRNRADAAENELAAIDVRQDHYPALQVANATLNEIVIGMKTRLKKSEQAPFGRYTARFERFEDLVLFLMFDADPAEVRHERTDSK